MVVNKKLFDRIILVICVALIVVFLTLIILDNYFLGYGAFQNNGVLYKAYQEKYHYAGVKLAGTIWESGDGAYKLDFTKPVTDIGEYDIDCTAVAQIDGVRYLAKLYLDKKTISLCQTEAPYSECLYGYFDFTDTEMRVQVKHSDVLIENNCMVLVAFIPCQTDYTVKSAQGT